MTRGNMHLRGALGQAAWQPGVAGGLVNAALSGSLLHALAHRPHVPVAPSPESRRAPGLAAIAGVAVVLGTSAPPPVGADALLEALAPWLSRSSNG